MQSIRVAALAALLAFSASADASDPPPNDGKAGDLAERCRDPIGSADAFGSGFCLGFIRGARDMAFLLDDVTPEEHRSCVPDGVTTGQLAKVFVRWADSHPEQLHVPAVVGVHRSTIAAFPCKPKAKP